MENPLSKPRSRRQTDPSLLNSYIKQPQNGLIFHERGTLKNGGGPYIRRLGPKRLGCNVTGFWVHVRMPLPCLGYHFWGGVQGYSHETTRGKVVQSNDPAIQSIASTASSSRKERPLPSTRITWRGSREPLGRHNPSQAQDMKWSGA